LAVFAICKESFQPTATYPSSSEYSRAYSTL